MAMTTADDQETAGGYHGLGAELHPVDRIIAGLQSGAAVGWVSRARPCKQAPDPQGDRLDCPRRIENRVVGAHQERGWLTSVWLSSMTS